MDNYRRLIETLKRAIGGNNNIPLVIGTVVSVGGDSCTVSYGAADNAEPLQLQGVRLKATIGDDGNYLLITPKVGSNVVLGSITGNFEDLCVVKVDEIEKIELLQNGLNILVDSTDDKVCVKNKEISLVDLFSKLVEIIRAVQVYTNTGPSGTPLPATLEALNDFETKFKMLLK